MTFKAYNKPCRSLLEIPNNKVDVVITSPPYNIGHRYGNNKDLLPQGDYFVVLSDMISGAHRVLKRDGLLVIDIASWIDASDGQWKAADYIVERCKKTGFFVYADWAYEATEPMSDTDTRGHSTEERILVFSKDEKLVGVAPQKSPFKSAYLFGADGRNEAYWPSDLVDCFVEVFDLGQGKVVVDPFMGSGLIGTRAVENGASFIGYEISD